MTRLGLRCMAFFVCTFATACTEDPPHTSDSGGEEVGPQERDGAAGEPWDASVDGGAPSVDEDEGADSDTSPAEDGGQAPDVSQQPDASQAVHANNEADASQALDASQQPDASQARDASAQTDSGIVLATDTGIGAQEPDGSVSIPLGPRAPCGSLGTSADILFDLGAPPATRIQFGDGVFVLGDWALYDASDRHLIARGNDALQPVTLVADILVVPRLEPVSGRTILDLRDVSDGHVAGSINEVYYDYGVARDGSYVWTNGQAGLRVWSPTATLLLTVPGKSYSSASVDAAPNELRGIAPGNKVDVVSIPSGTVQSAPFIGTFSSWFVGGDHFLTRVGDTVRVYTAAGGGGALTPLPTGSASVGAFGNYYWVQSGGGLGVYDIRIANQLVATVNSASDFSPVRAGLVGQFEGKTQVLNLTGATPALREVVTAVPPGYALVDELDDSKWLLLSNGTLALAGASAAEVQPLTCGTLETADLSPNGIWAIGVGAGQVFTGDLSNHAKATLVPLHAEKVQVADDGRTMLVTLPDPNRGANPRNGQMLLYSLPSGSLLRRLGHERDFSSLGYAKGGTRWATLDCQSGTECVGKIEALDSAATESTWTIPTASPPFLTAISPNAERTAIGIGGNTYIYQGSTLVGSATYSPGLWLDDNRLVLFFFDTISMGSRMSAASIVEPSGAVLSSAGIQTLNGIYLKDGFPTVEVLDGGMHILAHEQYSARTSGVTIVDVMTNAVFWSLPYCEAHGDVAINDANLLYSNGRQVRLIARP